ncbi:substrate-binding domain-containing protein [Rhodoferax saidenbachensis]|uniref:Inositol transport system substrate-binding protein n=1 Tax=Rhodoferax saidenbachensis TaxID=1484693 RepID=A0ABU1ZMW1_9BURK|nr:substrate-binding domain-containing protein [Rhodoferax saidenbachensis]MDR7306708.1 inositol transport system substrate-binding protein [Rhodoferax saidenbachensis]
MKHIRARALLALALTAPFAAQAQKIGLAMSEVDAFLSLLKNGVQVASARVGASVVMENAQTDKVTQLNQIQSLIAQKVDALIVVPVDTSATQRITSMAMNAGIPLIYVNRKPADFEQLPSGAAFVGSDEKVSGTLQAREVCRLMNGRGHVLVLMGDLSNEAARTRTQDVEDVLGTGLCSGIKVLDKRIGNWSRDRARMITTNILAAAKLSGKRFDAIIANNDEMALGAIAALKAAQQWTPEFIVGGIDATPDALQSMREGELKVTVFQNAEAQGGRAVEAALRLIRQQPVQRFVDVPFELVTPPSLPKYLAKN